MELRDHSGGAPLDAGEALRRLRHGDPGRDPEAALASLERLARRGPADAEALARAEAAIPGDPWARIGRALARLEDDAARAWEELRALPEALPGDWRPLWAAARAAEATRQAPLMAQGEALLHRVQALLPDWDGPAARLRALEDRCAFHGDPHYQAFMRALLDNLPVTSWVETGTFLGRSCAFLARSRPDLPMFTSEVNPLFHGLARRRLAPYSRVIQHLGPSTDALPRFEAEVPGPGDFPVFFLDAHWLEDWPLTRELDFIAARHPRCVIVIDDFRVPGQPQFKYDDYGGDKVCSLEAVSAHVPASGLRDNLFPRYPRAELPAHVPQTGFVAFFCGAEPEYARFAALPLAREKCFRHPVGGLGITAVTPPARPAAPPPRPVSAPAAAGADPGAASPEDIADFLADKSNPVLVSFPRTGSHWLRLVLERYFGRPLLTRTFFEFGRRDYLLLHTHDMGLTAVRENVLYLHRDPVDTVYSQMGYYGEDPSDRARAAHWADLYGQHLQKWLLDEAFTARKTVLDYGRIKADPVAELGKAIRHLGGTPDPERIRAALEGVDKAKVKEKTTHNPHVITLGGDYESARERFRAESGEWIWERALEGRPGLAEFFGRRPVARRPGHAPVRPAITRGEDPKIIGLLPGKNEAHRLPFCLRALSRFCDSIVYFDDHSTDGSVEVVEGLARECRVERIVRKGDDEFREAFYRSAPFRAGRELGGTHFICLDADEAFTANAMDGDLLRKRILRMRPGDSLELAWIQLWRSLYRYRHDGSVWTDNYKAFAFADDGEAAYPEKFIHIERVPAGLKGQRHRLPGYEIGVLHFQFLHWRNLLVKQAWYRCMERLHNPARPAAEINAQYGQSKDEAGLGLRPTPLEWFHRYAPFLDADAFQRPDTWRERKVLDWFAEKGTAHFADLDIWDVDWGAGLGLPVVGRGDGGGAPVSQALPQPGGYQGDSPAAAAWAARRASGGDWRPAGEGASEPDRHADLLSLGEALCGEGDWDGARSAFEDALRARPDDPRALNDLGVLEWRQGRREAALERLARALEIDSDDRTTILNCCEILAAMDQPDQARALGQAFLRRHPGDAEVGALLRALPGGD